MAKEKRQPASDDLDIPQDPLSKFNLGLELANITRCGGQHHAAANRILKATKRGIYKIHLAPYAKKPYSNDSDDNLLNRRYPTPFAQSPAKINLKYVLAFNQIKLLKLQPNNVLEESDLAYQSNFARIWRLRQR